MKSKITIKDIAKELGISASTVSRALRDSSEISEEVRKKVKAFAELYNYKPNKLALKLRNRKTMVIGVIIPEIIHHFFSEVIGGIEKVANRKDYNVMICLSNESYDKEVLNVKTLADDSVDGLIVSIAKETLFKKEFGHFHELLKSNIPLVLFDRVADEITCDQVIVDDVGGGYKATKHLLENGAKHVAILTTPDYVNVGELRTQGYIKALKEYGLDIDQDLILKIDETKDLKEQISQLITKNKTYPLGVFAVNEIYAATAMKVAREKNIDVPNNIAVIAYTNGIISEFSNPPLSTMAQHGVAMGEQAAELLLNRIEGGDDFRKDFQRIVFSTNLVARESTAKI